jgi:hypothetical protein
VIRWRILAVALAAGLANISAANAEPARSPFAPGADAPSYKYAVTPEAGAWLICVQTFKGKEAQALAEEMVELIRNDYRLPAYVYDRGWKERAEEQERVQKLRDQYWDTIEQLKGKGYEPIGGFRYKTVRVPDEYAVLAGKPKKNLKDMEAARDFLNDIRKLKPPPTKFSRAVVAGAEDEGTKTVQTGYAYLNPFASAMVVHNPSIPIEKKQDDPDKADEFIKEINSGEQYSVFKASKPWTLVVKVFQGEVQLAPKNTSMMAKFGLGKKEPALLNAGAQNAHVIAECLRSMKPSFEAFVMHQRSYSVVTVGQFKDKDDPELLALQRTLAGLQLKDQKSGVVYCALSAQPLPMKIPR